MLTETLVLDAFAVLAWLQDEPGAQFMESLFLKTEQDHRSLLHLSIINAGEIYYRLRKTGQTQQAGAFHKTLLNDLLPIKLQPATDERVWKASSLKARYPLSYADAFAVGLAKELDAVIITLDPEILALPPDVCRRRPLMDED